MTTEGEPTGRSTTGEDHPAGPIVDEHRMLRSRLDALTDAADRAGILSSLQDLPKKLEAHFAAEEGEGGLYEDLARRAPAVSEKLEALRGEHRAILDEVEELSRVVQADPGADGAISAATRDSVARCVGRLRRHELDESTMIGDIYYTDEGGQG